MEIPSVKELRVICRKKTKPNGYIVPITDYIAVYPAKLFLYLPFTPNQITLFWILLKTLMALLILSGNYVITIFAVLGYQLASIFDAVDGIVARFRKQFSLNGVYLDYIGHYFCNAFLLIAIAVGIYHRTGDASALLPAGIAVICYLLSKALTVNPAWWNDLENQIKVTKIIYTDNLSLRDQKKLLISYLFDFLRIDNPFNLMFFGLIFSFPELMLWIYALFLFLEIVRKLFFQYIRIYRAEVRN